MSHSRRQFLASLGVGMGMGCLGAPSVFARDDSNATGRRYHVCLSPEALEPSPDLLDVVASAGVDEISLAAFFYGHWPVGIDVVMRWRDRIEAKGLGVSIINVPLGHPGDSLGSSDGAFPLTPPRDWRLAVRPDGSTYAGTSLHDPATSANVAAVRALREKGVRRVFLDDDFRLATGPGTIGGCFCDPHRDAFLRRGGHAPARWEDLKHDVATRRLTPLLRDWLAFTGDALTDCFRAQEKALGPDGSLGIMVMYLGAEKAGIQLDQYKNMPLRVGELMFDDNSFGTPKGKCDELFSALFHRRFVAPEQAYSETTAYPSDRLSAGNMAAKLAVSTIADVRHTMFMSGLTPFPKTHWATLGPAMKRHKEIHAKLAGHAPRGPIKHFWGEASRCVGDDQPFSLPLALGIPFEVTSEPSRDGWTFLSSADADAARDGSLRSPGTRFLARSSSGDLVAGVGETWADLRAWKRSILDQLAGVPHLEGDDQERAAVLAWYPTARAALVWNLEDGPRDLIVRDGPLRRTIHAEPLELVLLEDIGGAS